MARWAVNYTNRPLQLAVGFPGMVQGQRLAKHRKYFPQDGGCKPGLTRGQPLAHRPTTLAAHGFFGRATFQVAWLS